MKLIIDRFEGKFAVCEDENKKLINIKKEDIPKEAKEGDILVLVEHRYVIDYTNTENRKKYIEVLTKDLWE